MVKVAKYIYVVLVVVLAGSTFVGGLLGTEFVKHYVYSSVWFVLLWSAFALVTLLMVFRQKLRRMTAQILFHVAILVILAGGLATFLLGQRGYIYLRQGVVESSFISEKGDKLYKLPFTVELDTFKIDYYPGTNAPRDYSSGVTITTEKGVSQEIVSMNKILKIDGYRLYQASYDDNHYNSWLNVNHDPWGIGITYSGYLLLGFSMVWLLFSRKGEFLSILRHPLLKGTLFFLFLLLPTGSLGAQTSENSSKRTPVISREVADSLRSMQVIYNNRISPFNTLASDLTIKISGDAGYMGLTPEQVIYSMVLYPGEWNNVPIILVKNKELRGELGISGKHASLTDLFENGVYKLEKFRGEDNLGEKPDSFEKALLETDEKVGIIFMLGEGSLIKFLSADSSLEPLPDSKINAELIYNKLSFSKIMFIFNLTAGFLSFLFLIYRMVWKGTGFKWANPLFSVALLLPFLFHTATICLRWYIAGRFPLGNGFETMQFLAWCVMLLALLFRKKQELMVPAGFLLSGFFLLVAYLGESNPMITPLVPVLLSPWLSVHVSVIMMSYALFAFMLVNGVLAVTISNFGSQNAGEHVERLTLLSRLFLYPAVFLLGAGICMGAVWANVSWGRYWGWDPKEVWALITFMVYGAALHGGSVPCFKRPLFFHWYLIFASITVVMTYFGVNWFFGGMHSY